MSTWTACTCELCWEVIGAARNQSGGFELFAAHLAVCTGTTR